MELLSQFISIIGIYALFWWCIEHLTTIFEYSFNSILPYLKFQKPKSLQEEYGEWAVVTGATDGIGKHYAIELAKKGMSICLISRTESKLSNLASEIEKSYKVKTKFIIADFSKGKPIYDHIKSQLSDIDIGILVNNVGMMQILPDEFKNISEDTLWEMINVNIGAITFMSKMVIPIMKDKNSGLILNVTSGSQYQPLPLAAIYGATKSYARSLSIALRKELADYNIKVHIIVPLYVKTNMTYFSTTPEAGNIFFPNAETYVKGAIKTIGKCSQTGGYWIHCIQFTLFTTLPEFVRIFIAHMHFKSFRQQYFEYQKATQVTQ